MIRIGIDLGTDKIRVVTAEEGVIFGGRLGEYKYYDMDKVIDSAFALIEKELGSVEY